MGTGIRVLCVDDAPDIVRLYRAIIDGESDMRCAGTLTDPSQVLDVVASEQPDIVLLDLTMPSVPNPFALIETLAEQQPSARVIVFSGYDDEETESAVMKAGAWGLISKMGESSIVLEAIRRVASGERLVMQRRAVRTHR